MVVVYNSTYKCMSSSIFFQNLKKDNLNQAQETIDFNSTPDNTRKVVQVY